MYKDSQGKVKLCVLHYDKLWEVEDQYFAEPIDSKIY